MALSAAATGQLGAAKRLLRMQRPGVAEGACWLLAVALTAATAVWPGISEVPDRGAAERDAAEVLRRVAASERTLAAAEHHYRPIGPQRGAAALELPGYEAPSRAAHFLVDAAAGEDGALLLRVVTRPEAARAGVAAVLLRQALPPPEDPADQQRAPAARLSASAAP